MEKGKQELYLSELFLETLNGDFSLNAVLKALGKCDEKVFQCTGVYGCVKKFLKRRFGISESKMKMLRNMQQEIWDFWDVYGEFDDMLTPGMRRRYFILQIN
ncbi:MAG: hypothetical protein HFJ09_16425 [Lachnospiraceae bacterium]|nr:hypothetical protein [Lachnospiraceae bacterium]